MRAYDGDLDDYAKLVLGAGRSEIAHEDPPRRRLRRRPGCKPCRCDRQIAAAEQKIRRFQDLLTRVDEALAKAAGAGAASRQAIELAQKRRELERALVAAEESWLELSIKADAGELKVAAILATLEQGCEVGCSQL